MKKFIGMLGLLTFIFCVFTNISAQERKLTEQEFSEIEGKSAEKTKGKSYRLKRGAKTYKKSDGSMLRFSDETSEYLPSGDSHTVMKWGTKESPDNSAEIIRIGPTTYSLNTNGVWREYPTKTSDPSEYKRREQEYETETTVEHFYKGKAILNNQNTDLYESKFINKTRQNGREWITPVTKLSWFNQDGMIVKVEEQIEAKEYIDHRYFEFEYDPNIKIEAPKMR